MGAGAEYFNVDVAQQHDEREPGSKVTHRLAYRQPFNCMLLLLLLLTMMVMVMMHRPTAIILLEFAVGILF